MRNLVLSTLLVVVSLLCEHLIGVDLFLCFVFPLNLLSAQILAVAGLDSVYLIENLVLPLLGKGIK